MRGGDEKGLGEQQDRILENTKGTQIPLISLWTPSKYIKNFNNQLQKDFLFFRKEDMFFQEETQMTNKHRKYIQHHL